MKARKKLPKKVFIRWRKEREDEPWLEVGEKMVDISEFDETIEAGVYKLEKEIKVKNITQVAF